MPLTFRGINYSQIPLENCGGIGAALHAAAANWHFHVLSPVCLYNPFPDHFALVIEEDGNLPMIADAGTTFPEVDKDLVKLLHGQDILDARMTSDVTAASSRLLSHVKALQDAGEAWHHHMHFVGCVFNPHPGKWSISIESRDTFFAEAYSEEPVEILREVEVIYFANLAAKQSCGCGI
jgi:hypothetical protein